MNNCNDNGDNNTRTNHGHSHGHTHTASVISDQSHIPTLKSNPRKAASGPQQEPITAPNWLHPPTRWKHRVDSSEDQLENQRDIVYFCKSQLYIGVSAFCPHSLLGFQTRRFLLLLLLLLRFANRIFDHSLARSLSLRVNSPTR